MIRFGVLGPVGVADGGVLTAVPGPMPRTVLAALLISANRVVGAGHLVDVLWGENPPATAMASLHNHVRRLRAGLWQAGGGRLRAVAPGYVLDVAPDELDLAEFIRLAGLGRAALTAGNWLDAARNLAQALALWRGDPLADVRSQMLREREVPRLSELRLQALEGRIDAELKLGHGAELTAELRGLTAANPLHERFHAQLMLARYASGRRAEALEAYRRAREVLVEQAGVEPGTELRQLHQRMLAEPVLSGC
ncbi:MAG TPA: AfsR/SARP family transcriptional regulator [Streptosporangiaceae bacterium]